MNNIINFVVENIQGNPRIDYYLSKNYKNLSRTKIKNLILNKFLKINGQVVNSPSKKINLGDKIYLKIIEENNVTLKPYDYNLDIIFEEARNILINNSVNLENLFTALKLNIVYLALTIALFYFSFNIARKKGTLINIGE